MVQGQCRVCQPLEGTASPAKHAVSALDGKVLPQDGTACKRLWIEDRHNCIMNAMLSSPIAARE